MDDGHFEGGPPEALEVNPTLKHVPFFSDEWRYSEHLQLYPFTEEVGNFEDQRRIARQSINDDYVDNEDLGLDCSDDDGPEPMEVDEELARDPVMRGQSYCFMCATAGDCSLVTQRKAINSIFASAASISDIELAKRVHFVFMSNIQPLVQRIWTVSSIMDHMLKHDLDPVRVQAHVVRRLIQIEGNYAATAQVVDEDGNVVAPDHTHTRHYVQLLSQLQRANTEFARLNKMS